MEGHLLTHTCIADAAVVGVADDFAGELPLGFIVLKPEVDRAVKEDPAFAEEVRFDIFEVLALSSTCHMFQQRYYSMLRKPNPVTSGLLEEWFLLMPFLAMLPVRSFDVFYDSKQRNILVHPLLLDIALKCNPFFLRLKGSLFFWMMEIHLYCSLSNSPIYYDTISYFNQRNLL